MYAKMTKHAAILNAYSQYLFRRMKTIAEVVASLANPQKHAALDLALMLWVPTHRTAVVAVFHVSLAKYARTDFVNTLVR